MRAKASSRQICAGSPINRTNPGELRFTFSRFLPAPAVEQRWFRVEAVINHVGAETTERSCIILLATANWWPLTSAGAPLSNSVNLTYCLRRLFGPAASHSTG